MFMFNYIGGGLIVVMVFSLFFGVVFVMVLLEMGVLLVVILKGVFVVCMMIIGFVMMLVLVGVVCFGFSFMVMLGWDVVSSLVMYIGVVLFGLVLY